MRLSPTARVKAATALLSLSVLVSVVRAGIKARLAETIQPSSIDDYGKPFIALKQALPRRGVVGYVRDPDEQGRGLDYFLAQYFLAPVQVEITSEHELVVGNFRRTAVDAEWAARHDLIPLQDFSAEVKLFRRKLK